MRWLAPLLFIVVTFPGCRKAAKPAEGPQDFSEKEEEALWEEPKKKEEPPPPAEPAGPVKPTSPPPDGIGGFKFGQARKEAQAMCTAAKGKWKKTKQTYTCSKAPEDAGLEGAPVLSFCEEKLCAIGIAYTPDVPEFPAWDAIYTKVKDSLVSKHGEPTVNSDTVTEECKNEKFVVCMEVNGVEKEVSWQWDTHTVSLRMSKKKVGDGPPAIRLTSVPKALPAGATPPAAPPADAAATPAPAAAAPAPTQ
jgi:hypothetical protein